MLCFLSGMILLITPVGAQNGGLPFMRNFSPKAYDFHPQNWAIAQDSRGVVFIANTAGLLEYDGVRWRAHELFESLTIVSLAFDAGDTLFIGGRGRFGYVRADPAGRPVFHSLLRHLPPEKRQVRMVWETVATTHGVYFRTKNHIFRWDGRRLNSWDTPTAFGHISAVRDTLYVLEKGRGLKMLAGDSLRPLPGSKALARHSVNAIVPYDGRSILLATGAGGLYIYDGRHLRRFKTEADAFFRENRLYHGTRLSGPEKGWALATTRGGLIILDQQGRIRLLLNKKTGLPGNKVHYVYQDRQQALWLSLNNGLSRVELASPFALFDQRQGIEGTPHTIIRHRGRLYVGTNRGLFRSPALPAQKLSGDRPMFIQVPGISGQVWALHSAAGRLLAGTGLGIYDIGEKHTRLITGLPVATYCFYPVPPGDSLYAGTRDGLLLLTRRRDGWRASGRVGGITEAIRTMARDARGDLWLGTAFQGLIRVRMGKRPAVERFDESRGLPGGMNYVYAIDRRLTVGSYRGLWRFNPALNHFLPDSTLAPFLADSTLTINRLAQDARGRVWAMAGKKKSNLYLGSPTPDGYVWHGKPFRRLVDMNSVLEIYPDEEGYVWLVGRDEKIYRYNTGGAPGGRPRFSALVRRVSVIPGDSLIWGGYNDGHTPRPVLAHKDNSLRFEYAATGYDHPAANRYRIMLEGYDDAFHPWTAETRKDYTGLPAGRYTFHVRAKNIYGEEGEAGRFTLTILTPWYLSWWAFSLYALAVVLLMALVVKIRMRHLRQKTKRLEQLVRERTGIIREQAEKLEALNKMKSRFFANISHEFRTPLTLILGPLQDMLAEGGNIDESGKRTLGLMQRNAQRLLRLINQLLDLSRLESGKLNLRLTREDPRIFVRGIVTSFASLARQKQVSLRFTAEETPTLRALCAQAWIDRDVLEKILYNLLSNALKFTPQGGSVKVSMSAHNRLGFIRLGVRDTGRGIPAGRLENIFERFYQVSADRGQEGTGIGLALTRELAELHHGEIKVTSEEGHGTEFILLLPVSAAYFSDGDFKAVPDTDGLSSSPRQAAPGGDGENTGAPAPPSHDDDVPVILVVDDHDDVRDYIRGHLRENFTVLEARTGREGLQTAAEAIPDMVISDVMMPEMDGYQLCAALKGNEKTSHIPVILLTARAAEKDKLSGLETGADDYLTKPFNSRELHARVRNLIRLRRELQKRFQHKALLTPRRVSEPSVEEAFLMRLMQALEENLADETFSVESLSATLNMGRRQLHRKIKAVTGETPGGFIRSVRLQRARQLLEAGTGTVSEIALRTGFGSISYFSRAFKEKFGISPSAV